MTEFVGVMWLNVIALLLLGFFAGVGALRGALASGMSLLSLAVAYGTGIWAAPAYGDRVAEAVGAPSWLGFPLAGSLGFLGALIAMGILSRVLRRREKRRRRGLPRAPGDRFIGGVFGMVRGSLVVLLLSYLALWVDALGSTGTVEGLPELGDSVAADVAAAVVEAGVAVAMGQEAGSAGRALARMLSRPADSIQGLQNLMAHPGIEELRADRAFWTYVEVGAVEVAMNQTSFLRIVHDESLRGNMAALGLVSSESAADPQRFRAEVGDVLREVAPRIKSLRDDPAIQALMEDPEVVALVNSGDHLALMSHPRFLAVVSRILENDGS